MDLREEDRRYREYLARLVAEEKEKERELDRLIQHEVEAVWQKRLDQWRTERLVRRKLMEQVIAARNEQIQERCEWSPFRFLFHWIGIFFSLG